MVARLLAVMILLYTFGCSPGEPCSQIVGIWGDSPDDKAGLFFSGQGTSKVLVDQCEGSPFHSYRCEGNTLYPLPVQGESACSSTFSIENDRLNLMAGEDCEEPSGTILLKDLVRIRSNCTNPLTCLHPGECTNQRDAYVEEPEAIMIVEGM